MHLIDLIVFFFFSNSVLMGDFGVLYCASAICQRDSSHLLYALASLSNPVKLEMSPYFCNFNFIPLVYVSVLLQYHTALITVALELCFEMGNVKSSNKFFKIVLAIQDLSEFHINFRMGFSIFSKKALGILIATH